ncbi:RDD family protein [Ereboglobus luteus]|uniref:Uncharacterized protein n=1 Tax=Ereboglobus luteus TaxID=1796921 RepID=A0A2U8E4I3_9BACT|nr:RDD family protein [Ereboglobus luteus]AWI09773.1 hypothetical protein CKA38_11395 [Ereboglobus luteus]
MKKILHLFTLLGAFSVLSCGVLQSQDNTPAEPQALPPTEAASGETPPAPDAQPASDTTAGDDEKPAKPEKKKRKSRDRASASRASGEIVTFFSDAIVPKDKKVESAVAVFGDVRVDGSANEAVAVIGSVTANSKVHEAVSIVGSTTVNGGAREAVAVVGNVYVNSHVTGQVVAVGGGVELGPDARVDGQVVALGGGIKRDESAIIGGEIVEMKLFNDINGFNVWITQAIAKGRLLAFDSALVWAWIIAGGFLLCYLLTALFVPKAVTAGAEALEQRPGGAFLAALLTAIIAPILVVLLAATGVGIFILVFAKLALALVGKAAFLAWIGHRARITHPLFAVLFGGVALALLYCVPVLGIVMWKFSSFLGAGMVVYAALLALRRRRDERDAARVEMAAAAAANPAQSGEPPVITGTEIVTSQTAASFATRAGFWVRAGALLIDFVLIAIVANVCHMGVLMLPLFAVYCVVMWALRGTTIGGIICGLKVVRLDGRRVDWVTAIVRALGGFISVAPAGLGFIWAAFDDERQAWHDKIAGTVVVYAPKGQSLV